VLDLGANIGSFSLFAAKSADRVYAFEPEKSNYEQLLKNIDINGAKNIIPIKKAVGGKSGSTLLYKSARNTAICSTAVEFSDTTEAVDVVTLSDAMKLCAVDHIDLLKIDIEGSEYDLFENVASAELARFLGAGSANGRFHSVRPGRRGLLHRP
jgi:FkbM family methyltransferase